MTLRATAERAWDTPRSRPFVGVEGTCPDWLVACSDKEGVLEQNSLTRLGFIAKEYMRT